MRQLKISPKNPRVLLDEENNEVLLFTGLHYRDIDEIIRRFNEFYKR